MAQNAKKTEHAGAKKGKGAYWGRKAPAKSDSRKTRRRSDELAIVEQLTDLKSNTA